MQDIFNAERWHYNEPDAYWTIQYEYRRNGADMQYRFYWKAWVRWSTSWYDYGLQLRLFLDGVQHNVTVKQETTNNPGWSYEGTTEWYTVANKTSGTTQFYASMFDTSRGQTKSTSSSYNLVVSGATSALGSISAFDVDVGVIIPITKYDASFVDTLLIAYGSTSIKTVSGITNGAKVTFTDAEKSVIYEKMSAVVSGTFTFTLTTKGGSTTIGTSSTTASGSISNANPTFSASQISYTDANKVLYAITGNATDNQRIVQNQSSLSVSFGSASGNKGARIIEYSLELNGATKTATASGTVNFGVINSSQDVTLYVTAKDSRGNITRVEKNIAILAWSLPTFTITLERLNNYEDETYLTVDASISSVGGINTIKSITYQYMEVGGSYSGSPIVYIENQSTNTIQMDKEKEFFFLITVEDAFDYDNREIHLAKGKFPLFIDTEKNAVGINEFPDENEALRVAGGVARFDEGIVLLSASKKFLLSVDDSGTLKITELK